MPHIIATDFRGIGIGLGYAQTEDYGERVVLGLLRDKGWMGRTFGRDSVGSDFAAQLVQLRVQETYHLLDADTRAMYEGLCRGCEPLHPRAPATNCPRGPGPSSRDTMSLPAISAPPTSPPRSA